MKTYVSDTIGSTSEPCGAAVLTFLKSFSSSQVSLSLSLSHTPTHCKYPEVDWMCGNTVLEKKKARSRKTERPKHNPSVTCKQ